MAREAFPPERERTGRNDSERDVYPKSKLVGIREASRIGESATASRVEGGGSSKCDSHRRATH
eukprot:7391916-Pyramimonas_sp.AAC.1